MPSQAPDSLPPSPHTPHGHFSIHLVATSIFNASGTVLDTRDSAQEKVPPYSGYLLIRGGRAWKLHHANIEILNSVNLWLAQQGRVIATKSDDYLLDRRRESTTTSCPLTFIHQPSVYVWYAHTCTHTFTCTCECMHMHSHTPIYVCVKKIKFKVKLSKITPYKRGGGLQGYSP